MEEADILEARDNMEALEKDFDVLCDDRDKATNCIDSHLSLVGRKLTPTRSISNPASQAVIPGATFPPNRLIRK